MIYRKDKKEASLPFFPGDTVLLLRDGFPELFSKNREIINYSVQVVKDWREDDSLEDDVTFVVLKFK